MKCIEECKVTGLYCQNNHCRFWMDYQEDLNCALVCVEEHGALTLKEVAKRIGVSYVRVKQIQDKAIEKINKKMSKM